MKEIYIQDAKQVDDILVATIAVKEGTKEVFGREIKCRSAQELENTLTNLHAEVNKIPDEVSKVTIGKWTPKPKEEAPAPAEPTQEEKDQQAISALEIELEVEVTRAKKEKELKELALTDQGVAKKVAELKALKE